MFRFRQHSPTVVPPQASETMVFFRSQRFTEDGGGVSSHRVPPLKNRTQSTMYERHNCHTSNWFSNTLLELLTVFNLQILFSFSSLSPPYSTSCHYLSFRSSIINHLSLGPRLSSLAQRHRVLKGFKFSSLSPLSVLAHVFPSIHNRFSPSPLNHLSLTSPFSFCSRFPSSFIYHHLPCNPLSPR
jgi:hypothetical protein